MKSLIGIWPNAPSMKPSASAERPAFTRPGHQAEEHELDRRRAHEHRTRAEPVEQAADDELRHRGDREHREGERADHRGDIGPAAEPVALQPSGRHRGEPCSRSSKIFGSAKVVAWKMMLEMAVVMNTISDTRSSSAL